MKKIELLFILFILFSIKSTACGPFDRLYLAKEYHTFRACGENMSGTYSEEDLRADRRKENCKAWSDITSHDLSIDDIEKVVYKWELGEVEAIREAIAASATYSSSNAFAQWLVEHHDIEVIDFLIIAKTCEKARAAQNTKWYYATEGNDIEQQLHLVLDAAKNYPGKRLKERYHLQALRAHFSLQQYNECINYWQEYVQGDTISVLREMSLDYVAGALIRMNKKPEAIQLYLDNGYAYAAHLNSQSKEEAFQWVYKNNPDDPWLRIQLQQLIHKAELDNDQYKKLYPLIRKVCKERKCTDMAPWYYACAYLAEQFNHDKEAWRYIQSAEQAANDSDLKDAIHLLKIIIRVKRAPRYDIPLENELFAELQWLDQMMIEHLDENTRQKIQQNGINSHICGFSQYYWGDMMRKLLVAYVVPLCQKSGFKTRSLEYLNMADNYIFRLENNMVVTVYTMEENQELNSNTPYDWKNIRTTWEKYRKDTNISNNYDYRNDFFMNLDSIGVQYIKRQAYRMQHPQSRVDSFLLARSYTDVEYLHDIIGTQLLSAMQYGEAIKYLSLVSAGFNQSRNIYQYCNVNPFTKARYARPEVFYKLHFAQRMQALEDSIAHCTDANDKADLMLTYCRGLLNSIGGKCWPLTSYYDGSFYCYPLYSQHKRQQTDHIRKCYNRLRSEAFQTYTDKERAAQAYYDFCLFKSAVRRFPGTDVATFIKGHCDRLRDYTMR